MEATTATATVGDLDSPGQVLAYARERRMVADRAEADLLQAAVVWAEQHPAESLAAAEVFRASGYWVGSETPQSRSPAPEHRWSRSSPWPSSRPPSG